MAATFFWSTVIIFTNLVEKITKIRYAKFQSNYFNVIFVDLDQMNNFTMPIFSLVLIVFKIITPIRGYHTTSTQLRV